MMAGDWIKMRGNLWDDPRVSRLVEITETSEATVIGALYWLWATADQHSEDGAMPGLTLKQIDRKTGVAGIAAALCEIGWINDDPQGAVIARFEEHNGESAKRRLTDAKRKASSRAPKTADSDSRPRGVRDLSEILRTQDGQAADILGQISELEKEKRREEKKEERGSASEPLLVAQPAASAPATTSTRGSRLADDWVLPRAWGEWALAELPGWTADTVRLEAAKFGDFWHAKTGRDATKADWLATWRNWCRNAKPALQRNGQPVMSKDTRDAEAMRLLGFSDELADVIEA